MFHGGGAVISAPHTLPTPPDLLIPAAASFTRKANQTLPTLSARLSTQLTNAPARKTKLPSRLLGFLKPPRLLPLLITLFLSNICVLLFWLKPDSDTFIA